MPSVMQTASGSPASAASMIASARERRRHEDDRRVRAGLLARASATVLNTGQPSCVVPALARRHAADDVGAVGRGLLGVERALAAGDALDDEARVLVDQYSHVLSVRRVRGSAPRRCLASATTLSAASPIVSAVVKFRPLSLQHLLALLDVGAFHADDDRHRHAEVLDRGDHALRRGRRSAGCRRRC